MCLLQQQILLTDREKILQFFFNFVRKNCKTFNFHFKKNSRLKKNNASIFHIQFRLFLLLVSYFQIPVLQPSDAAR